MRHPFDGIIVPQVDVEQPTASRREALALLVAAGAASLATGVASAADPAGAAVEGEAKPVEPPTAEASKPQFHLYYVVPKELRKFDARRRMDLKVGGEQLPGLPLHKELGDKPGFLAWLSDDDAAKVKAADDVATAHTLAPADITVQGKPPEKGTATLWVSAAPLGWRTPPARDTYLDIQQLGALWTAQFAMKDGVAVIANDKVRQPFVQFAAGKVQAEVIDAIKSQPQVYALQWLTPVAEATRRGGEEGVVTTEALGEEAGTTLAAFEEGASTRAVGEEGGVTTFALGEEGASTMRLGEEGGVSTKARGEEGGVSTRALGEEGGGISTKALGEEGGGGGVTTQALGEEGGGIERVPRPTPKPQ